MFGSVCVCSKPFTLKLSMPETKRLPHRSLHTHLARGTSPESVCLQPPAPPSASGLFPPLRPLTCDSPPLFPLLRPPCLRDLRGACGLCWLLRPTLGLRGPHRPASLSLRSASFHQWELHCPPRGSQPQPFPSHPSSLLCLLCFTGFFSSPPALDYKFQEGRGLCLFCSLLNLPAKDCL